MKIYCLNWSTSKSCRNNCLVWVIFILFYFIFFVRHLLRGKHLSSTECNSSESSNISQSYASYQQNWLAISAQKLFFNSLSHYINSLCPHQSNRQMLDSASISSFDSVLSCKCHSGQFVNYLDYLNDARINIDRCVSSLKLWKNSYTKPCSILNVVHDQSVIFCTVNGNLNNNREDDDDNDNAGTKSANDLKKDSHNSEQFVSKMNLMPLTECSFSTDSPIGPFLSALFERLERFFENDILTNLHLTALVTRLCYFPHKLSLSLFFDETLARTKGVPCLLHLLQKLGLEAQNYCDELPNFETTFQSAKINLQSMPIGELNCQLLTANHHTKSSGFSLNKATTPEGLLIFPFSFKSEFN